MGVVSFEGGDPSSGEGELSSGGSDVPFRDFLSFGGELDLILGDGLPEGDLSGDLLVPTGAILARLGDREDSARSMAPDSKLLGLVCVRRSFRLPVDEQRDGMGWGGAPMTRRWRGIDCCGCDGSPAGG